MTTNQMQIDIFNASVETLSRSQWNIDETLEKLSELTSLEDNWDSYGAIAPTKDAFIGSVQMAYELFNESTPIPDVFPVPNGNIQFEWSCNDMDIEIEIESNRKCYVSFEDMDTGEGWEEELTFHLTSLSEIVNELTNRFISSNHLRIVN